MSFRISTGRLRAASASRSCGLNAKRTSPSGEPFMSSARTRPSCCEPAFARSTFTVSEPAALSAALSASACATPPSITVTVRLPTIPARPVTNSPARPSCTPSDNQTSSASGVRRQETRQRRQARRCARPHAASARAFATTTRAAAAGCSGDAAAGFRYRNDRDRAAVGFGARQHVFAGADARVPGRGRGPAVIDQKRERRRSAGGRDRKDSTSVRRRRRSARRRAKAAAASATTACAPASLPWARCRTAAAPAGN